MIEVKVFVALNKEEIPPDQWNFLLEKLPRNLHRSVLRFKRWQDRQASLLGKLLLAHGLKTLGFSASLLEQISTDKYNRPTLPLDKDFNISHSGEYVVCAISNHRIGIDIELIRPVKLKNFHSVLTQKEIGILSELENPENLFFEIWSKKEAAIKADGKGFSNDLKQCEALGDRLFLDNQWWQLKEIIIHPEYKCFLAAADEFGMVNLHNVAF